MSDKTSRTEEEIDLGQIFQMIGNGVSNLVNWVGSLFERIWNLFISILIFFRKRIIPLGIAAVIGGILGFVLELTEDTTYEATLVVEPNYQSGRQLYKNIAYYNELVKQEKIETLATTFEISEEEARTLVSFEITPVINENYLLSTYDEFLISIDSNTASNFDYETYKDNFKAYSFAQHEIEVVSLSNEVFVKLEKAIINGIVENNYFQRLQDSEQDILIRNENYLNASLKDVDTLRKVYQEVLLKEAGREETGGTQINMSANKETGQEIKLFSEETRIYKELDQLNRTRVRKGEILNVVSGFQAIGFEQNHPMKRTVFLLPIFAVISVLMFYIVLALNAFLAKKSA